MQLNEINKRLLEVLKEYKAKKPEADKLARVYELKKAEYFMDERIKGIGNQTLREAEAYKMLDQEGLVKPYEQVKMELSLLYFEKEILIEMSRNLRNEKTETFSQ